MKDCFFGLLRSYLRVDNVLVRIVDTRVFHSFDQNYILRDFQIRENTYQNLKDVKKFEMSSDWSLAVNQSDTVYRHLDVVFNTRDKIILK